MLDNVDPEIVGAPEGQSASVPDSTDGFRVLLESKSTRNKIRAIVARVLRDNTADVEDVVQEVLIMALRGFIGYRHEAKFHTWIHTIARNAALMFLRSQKAKNAHPGDLKPDELISHSASPDTIVELYEVLRLLATINQNYREALALFLCGYTDYEIAEGLKLDRQNVKSRIFRSRQAMLAAIEERRKPKKPKRLVETAGQPLQHALLRLPGLNAAQ